MSTPLSELATIVQGKLIGDGDLAIADAQPLDKATENSITFLENDRYLTSLESCQAAAVVTTADFKIDNMAVIQVDEPLTAFLLIVRHFRGDQELAIRGIDPRAAIHHSCVVGQDTNIAAFAVVGEQCSIGAGCQIHSNVVIGRNCRIGDNVVLHPGVVIYDGSVLGNRVTIHANSVIGADGFGYRLHGGQHVKVPQLGNVEIEDDVEIGACTTIDRGTFQATRIGAGTKIDNLVQVAHNCQVGNHNLFVSQMGIAGSSSTGDYVVIAGQAGIVDHAHIGTGAIIGAKAGVTKDVAPGQRMLGAPATPERDQKRILMSMIKLPEMRQEIKKLKQQLAPAKDNAA